MNKHQFLSKIRSVDEQAYYKLKRIFHTVALNQDYAKKIRYTPAYLITDSPTQVLAALFHWDETPEGTVYWGDIFKHLPRPTK